ncbi:MAG: hypothetical protein GY757_59450 [bacterium]|nr:hypothetical protein [bacterium]
MTIIKRLSIVILLGILLFIPGCKKNEYLIIGNWTLTITSTDMNITTEVEFTGSKNSGSFQFLSPSAGSKYPNPGTYTVEDKTVNFSSCAEACIGEININFNGTFSGTDTIAGTGEEISEIGSTNFNWTARRM